MCQNFEDEMWRRESEHIRAEEEKEKKSRYENIAKLFAMKLIREEKEEFISCLAGALVFCLNQSHNQPFDEKCRLDPYFIAREIWGKAKELIYDEALDEVMRRFEK